MATVEAINARPLTRTIKLNGSLILKHDIYHTSKKMR